MYFWCGICRLSFSLKLRFSWFLRERLVVLMETRRTWDLGYEHLDLLSVFCCHQPPLKPLWWDGGALSLGLRWVWKSESSTWPLLIPSWLRQAGCLTFPVPQGASADTAEWLCYRWTVVKAWLSMRSHVIPSSRAGERHLFTAR